MAIIPQNRRDVKCLKGEEFETFFPLYLEVERFGDLPPTEVRFFPFTILLFSLFKLQCNC